jgi:UDP-N-acetylglucosamine 2-epimerase (non-hydrolysing)
MKTILFIFGTRPEAIKLAPVVDACRADFTVKVAVTGQHRQMLDQVLDFFSLVPDYDLNIMAEDQSLFDITTRSLLRIGEIIEETRPDLVIVQGDTTTAFAGALAGFYRKVKVAHVEAGLRSFNKYSPFPEEMNRIVAGQIADIHFAPTQGARRNLLAENIRDESIFVVGNSVIDALFMGLDRVRKNEATYARPFAFLTTGKRMVLVTVHRRESFGRPLDDICSAIRDISNEDLEIIYPVHLNPHVRKQVFARLDGINNVHLIDPVDYPHLLWLMDRSYLVLTDSGGIQEEAPSLGKPVLVLREVTERTEGITAGTALLAGTTRERIRDMAIRLLTDEAAYAAMSKAVNPYGDGKSSGRIQAVLKDLLYI